LFAWEICGGKTPDASGTLMSRTKANRLRAKEWALRGEADSSGLYANRNTEAALSR
jgi:hypothetical protein